MSEMPQMHYYRLSSDLKTRRSSADADNPARYV